MPSKKPASNISEKVYALAFGAHPDDVELSCAATLLKLTRGGNTVAVCDLTEGEMGTRGTVAIRRSEATSAAAALGYSNRINLNLGDSKLEVSRGNILKVIAVIRRFQPSVVFASPPSERHPDHEAASLLVTRACFFAGLRKIITRHKGHLQTPHRPKHLLYYLQHHAELPDVIVDVSETFDESRAGLLAFKSQFFQAGSREPETKLTRKTFLEATTARAKYFGELIDADYGDGFLHRGALGVKNFSALFEA
ncbi:MAG: bacillithiol biosynthesis deacetylase BshB1 [Rhizobacter sp.]|nr:bacillithiol biosynthesis deacetylase BshB1 [Chlorobiales bacterium]